MDTWEWLLERSGATALEDAWTQLTSVTNTPTPPADAWDWLAIQSTATASDDAWVHLISILSSVVSDTGEGIATLLIATMLVVATDKPKGTMLAGDTIALLAQQPNDTTAFTDTKDTRTSLTANDESSYLENSSNKVILNI